MRRLAARQSQELHDILVMEACLGTNLFHHTRGQQRSSLLFWLCCYTLRCRCCLPLLLLS